MDQDSSPFLTNQSRINSLQVHLTSGLLSLSTIKDEDLNTIYEWTNGKQYLDNLTSKRSYHSYEDFVREMNAYFPHDRHEQYMIKRDDQSVGTIYSYQFNPVDSYIFISTYLHHRNHIGIGARATLMFCKYLFDEYMLFKIYFDVYSYNLRVIEQMQRQMQLEGVLKNQHVKDGQRYDVMRYAMYNNQEILTRYDGMEIKIEKK